MVETIENLSKVIRKEILFYLKSVQHTTFTIDETADYIRCAKVLIFLEFENKNRKQDKTTE